MHTEGSDFGVILVTEGLSALEELFNLSPSDELTVDGVPKTYERFRTVFLERTSTIYTSVGSYLANEFPLPVEPR